MQHKARNWFTAHIVSLLSKTFDDVVNVVSGNVPVKLMVEVLKPYISAKHYNKDPIGLLFRNSLKVICGNIVGSDVTH